MTNKPTQAQRDLRSAILSKAIDRQEGYTSFDEMCVAIDQLLATHVSKAVEAERQRMCDLAYDIYNTDKDKSGEWMDGVYAVVEALGKEVKDG